MMKHSNIHTWEGKTVLITGATGGVGLAAATLFFKAGADLFLTARDPEALASIHTEIFQGSQRVFYCPGDLKTAAGCRAIIDSCAEQLGRLDVLVNCAGVFAEEPAEYTTEETWDNLIDTNLKGSFFMCCYGIPLLKETGGNIVNISSDAGLIGNKYAAVYCASKGGVSVFTKALALELAEQGVRVNAVCPGVIETGMIRTNFLKSSFETRQEYDKQALSPYPQGSKARYIEPEEVARLILFLASEETAAAITGACVSIDMGVTAGY